MHRVIIVAVVMVMVVRQSAEQRVREVDGAETASSARLVRERVCPWGFVVGALGTRGGVARVRSSIAVMLML